MKTTTIFDKNLENFVEGKKIIINQGGTSSSKTYSILQLFITFMSSVKVKNKTFSVVSESMPHLSKGAMFDFFKILQEDNNYNIKNHNRSHNEYTIGTNKVQFFGVEDDSKVRGPRRDFLFINECNNVRYDTFRQLNMRTLNRTFLDFNPVAEFWAHTELLQDKDTGYVHSTYLDNPYTPQKVIDDLLKMKEMDPNWWLIYGEGKVGSLEGLIFHNYEIIKDPILKSNETIYGMDFGFTNDPTTLISVEKKDKELLIDELLYERGLTNEDISYKIENIGISRHDLIYADSDEPKSIEELSRRGWNIRGAVKGPDSIIKGIDLLKQYKMIIPNTALNLIKEMRGYSWIKDRNNNFINKPYGLDHCIDAIRYAMNGINDVGEFRVIGKLKFR